ncbi:flavin reductase [Microbacterium sp.]|uniref:flavin reductase n=1 Tax=Microbacterium sp. TaxID=51671 RepID=UPI003A872DB8
MTEHPIPGDARLAPVDDAVFRNVVGHFASGVTVITTVDDGVLYGTTASAVSSLSMDPPMMLMCLNRSSTTHDAVQRSGAYGISILTAEQGQLARQFGRKGGDKFAGVDYHLSEYGVPLLDGALATIVCAVDETAVGGTHTVFLGKVVEADATGGEPLAYYRGTFGRLVRGQEKAAYDATRDWVLRRRTPLGETLDAADLAAELGMDPVLINTALISLTAEALVTRTDDGSLTPTPITPAFIDNLYDARSAIETGVIETYLDRISDDDLAALREMADRIVGTTAVSADDLDAFLDLNMDYHVKLIDLAGSDQLTESYRRLNVTTVWEQTFDPADWSRQLGDGSIEQVTAAVESKDVTAVKDALRAETTRVKEGAKRVVAAYGGAV